MKSFNSSLALQGQEIKAFKDKFYEFAEEVKGRTNYYMFIFMALAFFAGVNMLSNLLKLFNVQP